MSKEYAGEEHRGTNGCPPGGRRTGDAVQDVAVDSFKNGAAKKIRRIEQIAGSALAALVISAAIAFFRGGAYVEHIESAITAAATRDSAILIEIRKNTTANQNHASEDDIRTAALAEAINSITRTMAVVVASQEQYAERLRRLEDR
jgi:hypothetical protein